MSMNTALSGLMAAQTEISATAHNISNVGTIGFRSSRVEFGDVFSSSPFSSQRTAIGTGVQVQRVAQDFTQGNVVTTGNLLDMAIEGQGFFAIQTMADANNAAGETRFTRSGAFMMDSQGNVMNGTGDSLMCWPVSVSGAPLTNNINLAVPLTIPKEMGEPIATTEVKLKVDLPSDDGMIGNQDAIPPTNPFDPDDSTTYGMRTTIPMFGADGKPLEAEAYFIKIAGPDSTSTDTVYEMHLRVAGEELDPTAPATANRVTFNAAGTIASGETLSFGPDGLIIDLGSSRLSENPFAVHAATHNGEAAGRLSNLEVDGAGSVWATYGTNGRKAIGQIVLANFTNPLGLKVQGKATYSATSESGAVMTGTAGTGGLGVLRSGALERSNVELTEELVNLISAQRNYQASAKAMETTTSLMQTIMNIRT